MTYFSEIDKTVDNQQPQSTDNTSTIQPQFPDIENIPRDKIQTIPYVMSFPGIWSPNKLRFRILPGTRFLCAVRHERRYHPYKCPREYFQRPKLRQLTSPAKKHMSGTKDNTRLFNKPPNSITSDVKTLGPVMNIQNLLMNFGVSYLTESDYRQMREWKSEFETSLTVPSSNILSYSNTDYKNPFFCIFMTYSVTQTRFNTVNKDDLAKPSQSPSKTNVEQKSSTGDTNLIVKTLDTGETKKEKQSKDDTESRNEKKARYEEYQNRQGDKVVDKASKAGETNDNQLLEQDTAGDKAYLITEPDDETNVNDNKQPVQDTAGDERGLNTDPGDDELDLNDEGLSHRNAEVCAFLGFKYEGDQSFYKKLLDQCHKPYSIDKQMILTDEGPPVTHLKAQDVSHYRYPLKKPRKDLMEVIRLQHDEKPYTDNTDSTKSRELKRKNSEPAPVPRRILFLNPSKKSRLEEGEGNMKTGGSNTVETNQLIPPKKTNATSCTKPPSSGRLIYLNPSVKSEREDDAAFGKKEAAPVVTGNFIPPYRRKFAAGSSRSSTSTGLMSSSPSKWPGFTRKWQNTPSKEKNDIAVKEANERANTSGHVGNSPMNRIICLDPNKHAPGITIRGDKDSNESFFKNQHKVSVKSRLGYKEHVPVKSRLGYKEHNFSHDSYNRQYNYNGAYNRHYDDTDTYFPPVHGKRRRGCRKKHNGTNAHPDRTDIFNYDSNRSRQQKKGRIVLNRRFNY